MVSFAPGPHPDATSRTNSSSSIRHPNSSRTGSSHISGLNFTSVSVSDPPSSFKDEDNQSTPKGLNRSLIFNRQTPPPPQPQPILSKDNIINSPTYPNAPQSSPQSNIHTPLTSTPLTTSFKIRPLPNYSGSGWNYDHNYNYNDMERQPLINHREGRNVSGRIMTVLLLLLCLGGIIALVALGGWRLGKGEGGGRWPGGPA